MAVSTIFLSLSQRMRRKRFEIVKKLLSSLKSDATILDVGGTEYYWESVGIAGTSFKIILLNTYQAVTSLPNVVSVKGDARDLHQYADNQFEFVHSNSVLQHMQTFEGQVMMANEIRRIGRSYYVQTPNHWFPMEHHFLLPGFQWLPYQWRVWLVRHFSMGYFPRKDSLAGAESVVNSIRLMTKKEFTSLFPDASIIVEKFFLLEKSFIAYK